MPRDVRCRLIASFRRKPPWSAARTTRPAAAIPTFASGGVEAGARRCFSRREVYACQTSLIAQRVRRIHPRGAARGERRSAEDEQETNREDPEDVEGLGPERHPREVVDLRDFGRETYGAEYRQQEAHENPEENAQSEARAAEQDPRKTKGAGHERGRRTERREDAYLPRLLREKNDERRDDRAGRHGHDEREDDEQQRLLDGERFEEVAVQDLPVEHGRVLSQNLSRGLHGLSRGGGPNELHLPQTLTGARGRETFEDCQRDHRPAIVHLGESGLDDRGDRERGSRRNGEAGRKRG